MMASSQPRRGQAEIAVRDMRRNDARNVAGLLTSVFAAPEATPGAVSRLRHAPIGLEVVDGWRRRCAGAWVVDAPGIGAVGAVFAAVTVEAGWFAGLAVDPAFRGLGIGGALTDRAVAHLRGAGCSLIGAEVAPHATDALAMYARRGLAPVDVTLRLQIASHALGALPPAQSFRRVAVGGAQPVATHPDAAAALAHLAAVPASPAAFVLADFGATGAALLCDPEPTAPPDGGALLVGPAHVWSPQVDHALLPALQAAATHAREFGRRYLELDVPLADGTLVSRLGRAGFTPIASMLRLAGPAAVYHERTALTILAGRWSV